MSIRRSARSRLLTNSILVAAFVVLASGADTCRYQELADALLRSLPTPAWGGIEPKQSPGLRIHVYPEWPKVLAEGTVVEPYEPVGGPGRKLRCGSSKGCLLVFIDTDHLAHFSHKVVIALWEIGLNRFHEPVIAGWWPLVDGTPVFNTVEDREKFFLPRMVKPVTIENPRFLWGRADWHMSPMTEPMPAATPTPAPPSGPGSLPPPFPAPSPPGDQPADAASSCSVWAVLVNGYANKADTFDEDTEGMYAVLLGLGVPEDHIYYLSPHHGAQPCQTKPIGAKCPIPHSEDVCPTPPPGGPCQTSKPDDLEQRTSLCNLRRVLTEHLPSRMGDSCDELLLFMSSHGEKDLLHLDQDLVCAADLKKWLEKINCERVTVVIEACQSGSFINDLQGPDRAIFTSTDAGGKSYQDVDATAPMGVFTGVWTPDPNPGDSGSETIWGYIEAFGTASSASPAFQGISLPEAVGYAKANDVMRINGLNDPQPDPDPLPDFIPHSCFDDSGTPDLAIEFSAGSQQGQTISAATAGPSLAYRCETNTIFLQVTNLASAPQPGALAAATVKLYWAPGPQADWPSDFFDHQAGTYFDHQIGDTVLVTHLGPGESQSLELDWEVAKSFKAGDEIVLVAAVDSPQDPFPLASGKVDDVVATTNNATTTKLSIVDRPNTMGCPAGCVSLR